MTFSELNYLSIAIAGVLNMFIGFLWYGPLFSKPWMRLMNFSPEYLAVRGNGMGFSYVISFVGALISATVFQMIFHSVNPASIIESILLSFLIWFGFIFFITVNQGLFAMKPIKLMLIDSGYYLITLILWAILFNFYA